MHTASIYYVLFSDKCLSERIKGKLVSRKVNETQSTGAVDSFTLNMAEVPAVRTDISHGMLVSVQAYLYQSSP
jgi:hypothetical protein